MKRILLTLLYMTVSLSICYEAKAMMMKNVKKQVTDEVIAVSKNGYKKTAIECRDITESAKK